MGQIMKKIIKKVMRNVQDYGLLITFKKTLTYLLMPIYENRLYRVYGINLDNFKPKQIENKRFVFKILEKRDKILIKQIEEMEEWLQDKLDSKLDERALCLVVTDRDKVAGFNLVSFRKTYLPLLKMNKTLKNDEAWSDQITIKREYRRNGLGIQLRYRIFNELKKRGIKRFWGASLALNKSNLELAGKAGFEVLMDIRYVKILGFKNWYLKAHGESDLLFEI
jgi:GNAT superfamily N-acetyltransferase